MERTVCKVAPAGQKNPGSALACRLKPPWEMQRFFLPRAGGQHSVTLGPANGRQMHVPLDYQLGELHLRPPLMK